MAEHMLILGVEDPHGQKTGVTAGYPEKLRKNQLAMLIPSKGFDGWKIWTVGDDIAWINPRREGQLHAQESGGFLFGVWQGTSIKTTLTRW